MINSIQSIEQNTRRQSPEFRVQNQQLGNRYADLIFRLLNQGTYDPVAKLFDVQKSMTVIDRYSKEHPHKSYETQVTLEVLQKQMKHMIKGFVTNNIVPIDLVIQIGQHLKPSDIQFHPQETSLYMNFYNVYDKFQGKDTLWFCTNEPPNDLIKAFADEGVMLDKDTMNNIFIRTKLGHEYGHAVEAIITRRRVKAKIDKLLADTPDKQLSDDDYVKLINDTRDQMLGEIGQTFPLPNDDINKTLMTFDQKNTLFTRVKTSIERISVGFELLALSDALISAGIGVEVAKKIVDRYINYATQGKNDFLALYNLCKEKQIDLDDAAFKLLVVKAAIAILDRKDLQDYLPVKFDSTMIGYDYPFNEDQIRIWISSVAK